MAILVHTMCSKEANLAEIERIGSFLQLQTPFS